MKVTYILTVGVVMVAVGAFFTRDMFGGQYDLDRVAGAEHPVRELIRDVPQLVNEIGAPATVAVIDRALAQKIIGADDCHLVLHLIGHEAYRVYQDDFASIAAANKRGICLDGYLHGVEAEIAATGDIDAQKRFCAYEKEHNLLKSPCYHGVGHSVFELTRDVKRSLAVCDSLADGPEPDIGNCYRGVFSEIGNRLSGYDTNTGMTIEPLHDPKQQLTSARPFGVCLTVKQQYRNDCYSQLSKLYFMLPEADPQFGIASCLSASTDASVVSLCTKTVSALAVRRILDTGTAADVAALLVRVASAQRGDALTGARSAYFGNNMNHELWSGMCDSITAPALRGQCLAL